jgi:hypothetical protein
MYDLILIAHNCNRWLVLAAMVWALYRNWSGWLTGRGWQPDTERAGRLFSTSLSVQFVLGLVLLAEPVGLARTAWSDPAAAFAQREVRFFAFEHPLQMFVAVGLAHLGTARSRKAPSAAAWYRWTLSCYTLAALAILAAIPWGRPLVRLP